MTNRKTVDGLDPKAPPSCVECRHRGQSWSYSKSLALGGFATETQICCRVRTIIGEPVSLSEARKGACGPSGKLFDKREQETSRRPWWKVWAA